MTNRHTEPKHSMPLLTPYNQLNWDQLETKASCCLLPCTASFGPQLSSILPVITFAADNKKMKTRHVLTLFLQITRTGT